MRIAWVFRTPPQRNIIRGKTSRWAWGVKTLRSSPGYKRGQQTFRPWLKSSLRPLGLGCLLCIACAGRLAEAMHSAPAFPALRRGCPSQEEPLRPMVPQHDEVKVSKDPFQVLLFCANYGILGFPCDSRRVGYGSRHRWHMRTRNMPWPAISAKYSAATPVAARRANEAKPRPANHSIPDAWNVTMERKDS